MKDHASKSSSLQGPLKFIRNIIHNILGYLLCSEDEPLNDRALLRKLYNSGQLDENKYHECCERCSKGNFDPEELQFPM